MQQVILNQTEQPNVDFKMYDEDDCGMSEISVNWFIAQKIAAQQRKALCFIPPVMEETV